jgi:enoyl-CoA hydratase/carnithine racemase
MLRRSLSSIVALLAIWGTVALAQPVAEGDWIRYETERFFIYLWKDVPPEKLPLSSPDPLQAKLDEIALSLEADLQSIEKALQLPYSVQQYGKIAIFVYASLEEYQQKTRCYLCAAHVTTLPNTPEVQALAATGRLNRYAIYAHLDNTPRGLGGFETAVKLGLGWPKGVFEMADELGFDNVVSALNKLAEKYGEYNRPDPLLTQLVSEGKLGKKTGQGFHAYAAEQTGYTEIIYEKKPPIAWITLNRPHRLNTITPKMIEELTDVLLKVWRDNEVRVVVLKGAGGRAFSAGADVTAFTEIRTKADGERFLRDFQEIMNIIESMPKPVIAGIDGYALGGGCELIQACDMRVATDRSEFGQPEVNLGLIPGAGGTQRLTRLVGLAKAVELMMLGTRIGAEEAYRIGLVNKVVPVERFEEELKALAEKLASQPPLALKAIKQAALLAREAPLSRGLAVERSLFSDLLFTKDFMEGISAFFAKRKPEFKGE